MQQDIFENSQVFPQVCKSCFSQNFKQKQQIYQCQFCKNNFYQKSTSFFRKSKLTQQQLSIMIECFINNDGCKLSQRIITKLSQQYVSLKTVSKYQKNILNLIHEDVNIKKQNIIFQNEVVELDETYLYKFRKGRKGRIVTIKYWVFGIRSRSTTKSVFYILSKRNKDNLIPLITKHIDKSCIILSDCWSVYVYSRNNIYMSHLEKYGYIHIYINHSEMFVSDWDDTIHTNTIERTWRSLKEYLQKLKPKKYLKQYISKFILDMNLNYEDIKIYIIQQLELNNNIWN